MYFVIYSGDPLRLARLCTDLMLEGWVVDIEYNEHKYIEDLPYLMGGNPSDNGKKILSFYQWNQDFEENGVLPVRFWITEKNYIEVLSQIINSKK